MKGRGGKWTSRGIWFRPLGAVWSANPRKAEKTIKAMSPARKRAFGRYAAHAYYAAKFVVAKFVELKRSLYRIRES